MNNAPRIRDANHNNHEFGEIQRKLLFAMIIVPLMTFCLVLSVGYYHYYNSLKSETIAKMEAIVNGHKKSIEDFLQERTTDLRLIIDSYDFEYLSQSEKLARVHHNLTEAGSGFVDLGIFNAEGVHLAYIGPFQLAGIVYRDQIWFQEVLKKSYYISDVFLGFRRVPHFIIAVARHSGDKTWVLRAAVDTVLFEQTVENVRIGQTGEAYLVSKDGLFQTRRRSGGELMTKDPEAHAYLEHHESTRNVISKDATGETFFYVTAWIKDDERLLVVRQKKDDAFKELNQAMTTIMIVSVVGVLLIVGSAFYSTNHIIRRLRELDEEKVQLGRQLIAAERLAQIGEMSAGVAHEINNPLQIIEMERSLIQVSVNEMIERGEITDSDDLAQINDSLDQIRLQLSRGGQITQGLLKFARKKDQAVQIVNLVGLVPEIVGLIKRRAEVEGIAFSEDINGEALPVQLDSAQFQQVLLNLLINAIDAVVKKNGSTGGEIRLWMKKMKQQVEIGVSDNGCGIRQNDMEKIFTPFFTTKPVGKGTGLGLAVCYGIVNQMGGRIQVASEEGLGTTFTIFLPLSVEASKQSKPQTAGQPASRDHHSRARSKS